MQHGQQLVRCAALVQTAEVSDKAAAVLVPPGAGAQSEAFLAHKLHE